jgi:hypothetical protein
MPHRAASHARWTLVALLVFASQPLRALQGGGTPDAGSCELSLQTDQEWKGLCGPVFGNKEATTLTVRRVSSLPGGTGRGDLKSTLMMIGKLPLPLMGTTDVELELFGNEGVMRTQANWRPMVLTNPSTTTLRFRVVEERQVEPTDLDRRIVERAAEILASEAVWNRADDRQCGPDDQTWSLYCAFHRASVDATGGFHNRRPALPIVRAILYERVAEERRRGRKYPHIMQDYNNDKATTLADVRSVFTEAAAQMKQ